MRHHNHRNDRNRSNRLAAPLLAGALLALLGVPAAAQTNALTYTGGGSSAPGGGLTLGWQFSLAAPVTVTSLGVWDQANDGLGEAHSVAIWSNTGTLLLQSNVPSGTAGTLSGGFRFSSGVTVVSGSATLPAGTYVVGASYATNNDTAAFNVFPANAPTASGVTYLQDRVANAQNTFPAGTGGSPYGFFGGNFQFTAAAPEPGSLALLALGTLAGGAVARRRRA